jgi:hypothetical protein
MVTTDVGAGLVEMTVIMTSTNVMMLTPYLIVSGITAVVPINSLAVLPSGALRIATNMGMFPPI